jgi:hypothetical protein
MSDHNTLSPSARHRWRRCAGSVRLCKGLEDRGSKAADDGTLTHHVLEDALLSGFMPTAGMFYIHPDLGKFTCDEDRAERVNFCLDYVYARTIELINYELLPEEFLDSSLVFGRPDLGGTCDVRILGDSVLEIIDLKDGRSPVGAEENDQMVIYAILALAKAISQGKKISEVWITILQPKNRLVGLLGIDTWKTTPQWLMAQIPEIIKEAQACDDPNAPLTPGEIQCKYCRAKGSCSALSNHLLVVTGVSFENLSLAHSVSNIDVDAVDDQRLKGIVLAAPLIRSLLEAAEEEALSRFKQGHPVPGLKVIQTAGRKSWAVDPTTMAEKLNAMGIPRTKLYRQTLLTPKQAKEIEWTKRDGTSVKLTDRQINVLEKEYITKGSGNYKVVSEDSGGEAVEVCPARLFGPVTKVEPVEDVPPWML